MKKINIIIFAIFVFQMKTYAQWTTYSNGEEYDHISAIAIDSKGNKWFGTGNGVLKFDGTNWVKYGSRFAELKPEEIGLPEFGVHALIIDAQDNKWFGVRGIVKFDGVNWTTYDIPNGSNSRQVGVVINKHRSGVGYSVNSIVLDKQGIFWFGIKNTVWKFDGINWNTYNQDSGLVRGDISTIAIDSEGNKWFGSSFGVSKFDGINWTTYNKENSNLVFYGATAHVFAIAIDAENNKWFGTNEGVVKFDGINWTTYIRKDGLGGRGVYAIAIDAQNNKWFGTDQGVSKFDGTTWTNYTVEDGLAGVPVHAIAIDSKGNKWFGTNKGISKFTGGSSDKKAQVISKSTTPEKVIEKMSSKSDVDENLPKITKKNPNAFAVVIGNRDYQNIKRVDYAINDAQSMKNYLLNVLGYSEGNIFYLENATKSVFETYFGTKDNPEGKLFNNIKADVSDVFIYYAGHGAPGLSDKKGYFVPVDCDPQYVQQGGYSLDLFYSNLAKLPAKSITIITDACFSGAEILKNISAITITVSNPIILMKNCVVMSSSTGSQVSTWFNEKQHGMFTYFFLKALQDREKSDKNKDGKLTFNEIFDYISDKTEGVPYYARKLNNIEQTPCIQGTGMYGVFIEYK